MPKYDITFTDLKLQMKAQGYKVRPSYCHDDYTTPSFSMPYPLKNKLDRIAKRNKITRSKVIQLLLEHANELDFLRQMGYGE